MELDIAIEAEWPDDTDWQLLAEHAAAALAGVAPEFANARLSISILFADDEAVHALNRQWRGKDRSTNVLSFPMLARAELLALSPAGPPELLGDIALAFETCASEAAGKGIPLADHATHLIVHGLLHLAGYDHETGEAQAIEMEEMETKALAIMGIADPYGDRNQN